VPKEGFEPFRAGEGQRIRHWDETTWVAHEVQRADISRLDLTSVETVGQVPMIPFFREIQVKGHHLSFELIRLKYRQYNPIYGKAFAGLRLDNSNKLTVLHPPVISGLTGNTRFRTNPCIQRPQSRNYLIGLAPLVGSLTRFCQSKKKAYDKYSHGAPVAQLFFGNRQSFNTLRPLCRKLFISS
jgi:hypothetical protein